MVSFLDEGSVVLALTAGKSQTLVRHLGQKVGLKSLCSWSLKKRLGRYNSMHLKCVTDSTMSLPFSLSFF